MADQATYLLMAAYMGTFAVLFVGVFGAITLIVREQEATERPVVATMDERPAIRTPVGMADSAASAAPASTGHAPAIQAT
jgi:hypothetical protein